MDPWHSACAVLVLDTLTGCTGRDARNSPRDWIEGNWSCDCNRGEALGLGHDREHCIGQWRFLAIGCDADGIEYDDLNSGYPPALLEEFRPYWRANRESARAGAA